tara:strand:- start:108166 stop:108726 length:561 start_codon:yes stop_codon:yes gene_type:complete
VTKFIKIGLALGLIATTTACQAIRYDDAHYWQREKPSETIYQRGPKAQQMLQRDIARCTAELNELRRLNAIKGGFPPDPTQRKMVAPSYAYPASQSQDLASWETPERNGYLLSENGDYYDFEGCMLEKGWERTKYVDYDVIKRSEVDYLEAMEDSQYRSKNNGRAKPDITYVDRSSVTKPYNEYNQ